MDYNGTVCLAKIYCMCESKRNSYRDMGIINLLAINALLNIMQKMCRKLSLNGQSLILKGMSSELILIGVFYA